jgi:hypothetical protein
MARVNPTLLAPPPEIPSPQPGSDGQLNGKQIMDSFTQVYDVAGGIRSTLIELQKEVTIAQSAPSKPRK